MSAEHLRLVREEEAEADDDGFWTMIDPPPLTMVIGVAAAGAVALLATPLLLGIAWAVRNFRKS